MISENKIKTRIGNKTQKLRLNINILGNTMGYILLNTILGCALANHFIFLDF
jgi:hypothetical protein